MYILPILTHFQVEVNQEFLGNEFSDRDSIVIGTI